MTKTQITGWVSTGKNWAEPAMQGDILRDYRHHLGAEIIPGTLNIRTSQPIQLNGSKGVIVNGKARNFYSAEVNGLHGYIVSWPRADPMTLEFVAVTNVRSELGLKDGDAVQILIDSRFLRAKPYAWAWYVLYRIKESGLVRPLMRMKRSLHKT